MSKNDLLKYKCPKCGLVVCSDGLEYYMETRGGVVE